MQNQNITNANPVSTNNLAHTYEFADEVFSNQQITDEQKVEILTMCNDGSQTARIQELRERINEQSAMKANALLGTMKF